MINHKEIIQGTEEWFDIKWRKIGGTLASGLHTKTDTLFIDLLSQFLEDFEFTEDSFKSSAMERGNELEPHAREYLSKYTGIEFKETGWLQSEENKLLGISPDGITEDETIQCEIKCFGRKKHTEVLINNEIPKEYIHQCVHAFTVNPKLEKLYFIAFRPECIKNSFIKEVTRDTEVNIGTKARPRKMTVESVRDYSIEFASELLKKIEENIENITF